MVRGRATLTVAAAGPELLRSKGDGFLAAPSGQTEAPARIRT